MTPPPKMKVPNKKRGIKVGSLIKRVDKIVNYA
jgi:hypothetical protein